MDKKISSKSILRLVAPTIIIFGYLKLNFLYSHFEIQILNYLEFTEVLTLFLPDLLVFAFLCSIVIIIRFLTDDMDSDYVKKRIKRENIISNLNFKKRFLYEIKKQKYGWILSLLIIIFLSVIYFRGDENFSQFYQIFICIPIFHGMLFLQTEINDKYYRMYSKRIHPHYNILFLLLFLLFGVSYFFSRIEISNIKEAFKETEVSFIYEKKRFKTNENILLVGETKRYLFLHFKERKQTNVYKKELIYNFHVKKL